MGLLAVWDGDEEKVILNANSNPDGRRQDRPRGKAGCGGVPAAGDGRAPQGLHGRAAVCACSDRGPPTPETGQLALPGRGPGPDRTLVTAGLRGTAPGPAPTALGTGGSAALGQQHVIFQPGPGQTLLLRDQCCRGSGGLTQAPRWARLGAAAPGTAHSSNGCPVGCPASCCHLPVVDMVKHTGPGSLCWSRVPRPLLGGPRWAPTVLTLRAAAAGQLVPAPPRPGHSRRCLCLPDPGIGLRGLWEPWAGARGRRGLRVK